MAHVDIKMIDDNLAEVTIDGVTFKNVIVKDFPEESPTQDVQWVFTLTTSKTDEKCFELLFDEIHINA